SGTVDVTVNPATPEVTQWPAASGITFGEPLSASILSGGTASVSGTFSFDDPAIIPDAGVYAADVTFTPDDSDNYISVSGTVDVTVNKADQVIEWDQDFQEIEYGSIITLYATASSGLPVTFISDNTDVAIITGNELEIVGYGVAEITAIQDGDQNYNPAPEVSKTINIIPTNININSISDFKVYPIPASEFISIESSEIIDYSYFIFDNSGQLVMQGVINQNLITTLNITNLVKGSYYLIIEFNNTTINKKIIKM
ncbi:MAG: T9SS C-terminal target domain-containing protein, partial [Bacteroidetes bacterium]